MQGTGKVDRPPAQAGTSEEVGVTDSPSPWDRYKLVIGLAIKKYINKIKYLKHNKKNIYLKFCIDKCDMDFLINSSEYHWNVTINASQSGDLSGW